ncbi:uncharacterized protein K489DRAFT_371359 [Dissoconium aciculare CBS 342.82]|uniref:Uncharacterized protein n=1 Tax=Dissoconium aciculare CBS 342.82 TaxID=1314786 RepID=A0A6J3M3D2_9PEZI|nr:uncharacterized protein K489DRAFT_371359 [Dissoconium aciculare CBS 342.82]KAF1822536.1 hypothetical protein K489DRAFT_371359 [Dissoconium aciculare CBS 342.82]
MPWPDHWLAPQARYYPVYHRRPSRYDIALSEQNSRLERRLETLDETNEKIKKRLEKQKTQGVKLKNYNKMTVEELKNFGRAKDFSDTIDRGRRRSSSADSHRRHHHHHGGGSGGEVCCDKYRKHHHHHHSGRISHDHHSHGIRCGCHSRCNGSDGDCPPAYPHHPHHHCNGGGQSGGDLSSFDESRLGKVEREVKEISDVTFGTRLEHKRASQRYRLGQDLRDMGFPGPSEWY